MSLKKLQFKTIEELKNQNLFKKFSENEFDESTSKSINVHEFLKNKKTNKNIYTSRRDFLKILGFTTAAVTLATCEAPITKSIPYLVNPEDGIIPTIPGVPDYYATTFYNGYDFGSIIVKTREGRPIKIKPNKDALLFGKTNSRAQAWILSLYNNKKIKKPKIKHKNNFISTNWKTIDNWLIKGLNQTNKENKNILILSNSLPSPSTKKIINQFKNKYPTTQHIIYDDLSYSQALDASEQVFGKRALPIYDLKKAKLIVSFEADFLNDWNGGHMEDAYVESKKPGKNMLRHIQIESNLSMTGANADIRIPMKPSKVIKLLIEIYKAFEGESKNKEANKIMRSLKSKGNEAVVLVDGDVDAYIIGHLINKKLDTKVIKKDEFLLIKESNDLLFENTLQKINKGEFKVLINFNTNPVYSYYNSDLVKKAISKIEYSISLVEEENETTKLTKAVVPIPHGLESWGDYQFSSKIYSLSQPTIQKIYSTRSFQDSLLIWMNTSDNYYQIIKKNWENSILKNRYSFNQALFNGINIINSNDKLTYLNINDKKSLENLKNKINNSKENWELKLYTKPSIGNGSLSSNPWLQELPDPISRISWDNYLTINYLDAKKLGLINKLDGKMALNGSVVNLHLNTNIIKNIPVFIQPGQAEGSLGLALGYGKKEINIKNNIGVNAFPFLFHGNKVQFNIKIEKTKNLHKFASIQIQNTLVGRYEIAREISNYDFINKPKSEWNEDNIVHSYTGEKSINESDLWDSHKSPTGPKFNLSIDMNSCIGCGACVIACQSENNIPVVGKDEIRRSRDMYWLRIDRYYSSEKKIDIKESISNNLNEKEENDILLYPAIKNPNIIFQPIMCQHCNHAPCESVCPVAATSHGEQGQNQMAYNRCIGTRYCANNCPYKVRRFNWFNYSNNKKFDYHMNNDLGRMVLNPDVVTRSRGVMEKCSMCIQMTQASILHAKIEGRKVKDEEFQTSCTEACPTKALEFGDIYDVKSKIRTLSNDKRKYVLLEDIGTKPNVFYHYKIRNK